MISTILFLLLRKNKLISSATEKQKQMQLILLTQHIFGHKICLVGAHGKCMQSFTTVVSQNLLHNGKEKGDLMHTWKKEIGHLQRNNLPRTSSL